MGQTHERVTPERSAQMRLIRAHDTKPEWVVRRALHAAGLRYRLHAKDLPGRPDIVFHKARIAVFVHGCFWHQHPDPGCKLARMPKSRPEFWKPKLMGNRSRDETVAARLAGEGWRVFEIWECELRPPRLAMIIEEVRRAVEPGRTKA